jgi:hypothetical protein
VPRGNTGVISRQRFIQQAGVGVQKLGEAGNILVGKALHAHIAKPWAGIMNRLAKIAAGAQHAKRSRVHALHNHGALLCTDTHFLPRVRRRVLVQILP